MHEIIHYLDDAENDLYQNWLDSLRDRVAKVAIIQRVARMEVGLFGDCRSLRDGVWELRVDVGAGYRVYQNKKDTHFNCLNKQHSLNSCPWPAPVAPPSRWPTHLSETYADNFESGWISVLFL